MGHYPKTTGDLVTVNIRNADKAGGDGRLLLDEQLKEIMDILHPVGEVKFMMTDQVDPWIEKMAVYDQVWTGIDGSLVKVSDYPRLFNDIGYKYGYSNTNPNGTYTYSFTDNNGNSKSLVIYNDLDIDGNAKPVPEGESPLYFRLPNLSGRFLRCAGTASYVNKWTDTDGTVRQLLTEYKAEMYKGQLDAQRGISGELPSNMVQLSRSDIALDSVGRGCFSKFSIHGTESYYSRFNVGSFSSYTLGAPFDSSYVTPVQGESSQISISTASLIRIK